MALALYDLLLFLAGGAVLGVGLLPRYVERLPLSKPLLYVLFGYVIFSLPLGLPSPDPLTQGTIAEHLVELGVIVSLMVAGLKLDRPPGLRRWASTWRLLVITMPVSIGLAALVGWGVAGLAIPSALLLGAVIAPTDPVLASEVQVEGPGGSDESEPRPDAAGGEDEVRFALTSEAGLNDGFAFPFTNLAVAVALVGIAPGNWVGEWLLVDVVFRIAAGVAAGIGLGWLMARLVFVREIEPDAPSAKSLLGVEALGATLLVYGATEVVGGYGFIAVFVAATTLRNYDRDHPYHESLHDLAEQAEQLLMALIMILFGGLIAGDLFGPLNAEMALAAAAIAFLVRPAAGLVGLLGFDRSWAERGVISAYGLRGIGTFYYLSFGLNEAAFPDPNGLWALAGFTVLLSLVFGGMTATPVVEKWLGDEPAVDVSDVTDDVSDVPDDVPDATE